MLDSLKILLANDSVNGCYYNNNLNNEYLMPLDILQKGIEYAKNKNINISVVYPNRQLPEEYIRILSLTNHKKIEAINNLRTTKNSIIVLDSIDSLLTNTLNTSNDYILRINKQDLFLNWNKLPYESNINLRIVIKDIPSFNESDFKTYHMIINNIADRLSKLDYGKNMLVVDNIVKRIFITEMENCGAGDTNITLAPNGLFYICPGFYYDNLYPIGSLDRGIAIKDQQLYMLQHAPICKHCDAYQCKRCIWLNKKMTLEVNTPSRQQCVISHLERNAGRLLLLNLQDRGYLQDKFIKDIYYLDPFETRKDW